MRYPSFSLLSVIPETRPVLMTSESEGTENNVVFSQKLSITHAYHPQTLPLGQLQASRHLKQIGVTCLQDHHTGVHPVSVDATSREAVAIVCRPGFAQGCLSRWRFHGTRLHNCSQQLLPNQRIDLEICCSNCWDAWSFFVEYEYRLIQTAGF